MAPVTGARWRNLVAGALLAAAAGSGVGASPVAAADSHSALWRGLKAGPEVLRSQASQLAEIARRNNASRAAIAHVLKDPSSRVSGDGAISFAEPASPQSPTSEATAAASFPYADTFRLHSLPGSNRVIFLDFNGQSISGTDWPADDSGTYTARPYDTDGSATFSTAEMDAVQAVWQRVSEDYSPFAVDVTTEDPGFAKIDRASSTDTEFGTRVVITNSPASDVTSVSTRGVAYVGAFDQTGAVTHARRQPAWAFPAGLSFNTKRLADVITHEVGHTLGLSHDGLVGGTAYYSGSGVWAPIMGNGTTRPVVQWSKGEYTNANNLEDDLAVIQSHGAAARSDDHTNDLSTATPFASSGTGLITPKAGLDYDLFKYTATTTGNVTFRATPAPSGPNLDIVLTLYSASGAKLAQANPTVAYVSESTASGLDAALTLGVTVGASYYVQVGPSGFQTPQTGYSTYGSLGQYSIAASVPGSVPKRLLENPGFENGSAYPAPWTSSYGVIDSSTAQPARTGSWKALLNGRGVANTEALAQTVTVPAGAASATLSLWLHVATSETQPSAFDTLRVQVRSSSNVVLKTLATYSNLNAAAGYAQKSFPVTQFAGQTVRIYLLGHEDASLQTSFDLDDFALSRS
jgi:hypothetical protein